MDQVRRIHIPGMLYKTLIVWPVIGVLLAFVFSGYEERPLHGLYTAIAFGRRPLFGPGGLPGHVDSGPGQRPHRRRLQQEPEAGFTSPSRPAP
jgi:hypothetical protein